MKSVRYNEAPECHNDIGSDSAIVSRLIVSRATRKLHIVSDGLCKVVEGGRIRLRAIS